MILLCTYCSGTACAFLRTCSSTAWRPCSVLALPPTPHSGIMAWTSRASSSAWSALVALATWLSSSARPWALRSQSSPHLTTSGRRHWKYSKQTISSSARTRRRCRCTSHPLTSTLKHPHPPPPPPPYLTPSVADLKAAHFLIGTNEKEMQVHSLPTHKHTQTTVPPPPPFPYLTPSVALQLAPCRPQGRPFPHQQEGDAGRHLTHSQAHTPPPPPPPPTPRAPLALHCSLHRAD